MTNYSVKTVSEFIKAAPKEARAHLQTIRKAIKTVLPKAEEKIGYGKPYYKTSRWVVGYDVYTKHITFEIWEGTLPRDIKEALEERGYKTGSKTFQIRFDQKVPLTLLKKLIKVQAAYAAKKVLKKKKK